MFRLWGKLFKDNRMLKDTVIENDTTDTRTHKIFQSLDDICLKIKSINFGKRIMVDKKVSEFIRVKL